MSVVNIIKTGYETHFIESLYYLKCGLKMQ